MNTVYKCSSYSFVLYFFIYVSIFPLITSILCNEINPNKWILHLDVNDTFVDGQVLSLCNRYTKELHILPTSEHASKVLFSWDSLNIFYNLKKIVISNLNLHIMYNFGSFKSKNSLLDLEISSCIALSLPTVRYLEYFPKLQNLNLSNNKLKYIPPDLFRYSKNFVRVDLSKNYLEYLPLVRTEASNYEIDVNANPIKCNCINSWLKSIFQFQNIPDCESWPEPCPESFTADVSSSSPIAKHNDSYELIAKVAGEFDLICNANSSLPMRFAWFSKDGIIPGPGWNDFGSTSFDEIMNLSLQPLIAAMKFNVSQKTKSSSHLKVSYARGFFQGRWYCIVRNPITSVDTSLKPIHLKVESYYYDFVRIICLIISLCSTVSLLLVGIVGGIIRHMIDTSCLKKPAPDFSMGSKTYLGIIPVPLLDDCNVSKTSGSAPTEYGAHNRSISILSGASSVNNNGESSINTRMLVDLPESPHHHFAEYGSADIKLLIPDENMLIKYKELLHNLSESRYHLDPDIFRNNLENFRDCLKRDIGHNLKLQRYCPESDGDVDFAPRRLSTVDRMKASVQESLGALTNLCSGGTQRFHEIDPLACGQTIYLYKVSYDEISQTKTRKIEDKFSF